MFIGKAALWTEMGYGCVGSEIETGVRLYRESGLSKRARTSSRCVRCDVEEGT